MNSHFVGSLDSSVDPENETDPKETTNRNADTDNNVSVSSTARIGIVDGSLWVRDGIGSSEREGGIDLGGELSLDTILDIEWRVGRFDIGIQGLELVRGDVSQPLSQQVVLITSPGSGLVDRQAVGLDLGYCIVSHAPLVNTRLTIDIKSRADERREGVEQLTGSIGRVDLVISLVQLLIWSDLRQRPMGTDFH